MDGTLKQKRVNDAVLTELARGYSNAEHIGTKIFPIVVVSKEGGKVPLFNKEAFKIYNTERAIRAASNQISPEGRSTVDFVLTEHDLSYPIDYRELDEDDIPLKMHATNVVSNGINLRLEKQIADLLQNTANYPATNRITLTTGSGFNQSASNPIQIIDDAKNAVRAQIAKYPNVAVLGAITYMALKNHPSIVDRIKYTMNAVVTPDLLRQLLGFDELFIGNAVYTNDTNVNADLFGDFMGLYYLPKAQTNEKRSYYEPSFGYTFKKKAYPSVDTFDRDGKVLFVRSTDIFQPKIVGPDAGYLISNTVI
ncbi:MAG: hypothetical protein IPM32_14315 [Ignavibacteriae bacterium]|nr:hypothetical protein [Ignavibacteriota bacterium]